MVVRVWRHALLRGWGWVSLLPIQFLFPAALLPVSAISLVLFLFLIHDLDLLGHYLVFDFFVEQRLLCSLALLQDPIDFFSV